MEFSISANNGDSVKINADNWMAALGKALPFFSMDATAKMVCTPGADGSVLVETPATRSTWMVRPMEQRVQVVVAASSEQLVDLLEEDEEEVSPPPETSAPAAALPTFAMPVASTLRRERPPEQVVADDDEDEDEEESLAERLFDLSLDLTEAEPNRACQLGLDLILEFVPVEAGSVARGTLNDNALTFVAATGPVASEIIGKKVNFGRGLIGMCFDMKATLQVGDVHADSRHLAYMDAKTGFDTRTALCVPILDADNQSYGAIQLLNPPSGEFEAEHVETVETIAKTLAGALSTHAGAN